MLNYSEKFPTDFNFLIRPFEECPQKKSDSGNGYYIVSDVWGTCFHRIASRKERFEVQWIDNRTYTKIPASAIAKTYHVVVNFKHQAFKLDVQDRYRIVGIHQPVRHVAKEYLTQSFIVYSPYADFSIKKIEDNEYIREGLWIENKDGIYVRPHSLYKFPMNYINQF